MTRGASPAVRASRAPTHAAGGRRLERAGSPPRRGSHARGEPAGEVSERVDSQRGGARAARAGELGRGGRRPGPGRRRMGGPLGLPTRAPGLPTARSARGEGLRRCPIQAARLPRLPTPVPPDQARPTAPGACAPHPLAKPVRVFPLSTLSSRSP